MFKQLIYSSENNFADTLSRLSPAAVYQYTWLYICTRNLLKILNKEKSENIETTIIVDHIPGWEV